MSLLTVTQNEENTNWCINDSKHTDKQYDERKNDEMRLLRLFISSKSIEQVKGNS